MRIYLFFAALISLHCSMALSQVRHLVFDLDGLLVQGVPQRNVDSFKEKDLLLTVEEGGQKRWYYAAPHAAGVIRSLNNLPQLLIHFYSAKDPRWVHAVLNKIYVNKERGVTLANLVETNSASKFFTSEHLVNGKIDLRKISSDVKNIVYFTTNKGQLVPGQESQEFYTGQNFYVFESYEGAEGERTRLGADSPHAVFLPESRKGWFQERFRFPRLNSAVRTALKTGKGLIKDDVMRAFLQNPEERIALGVKQMKDDWSEIGLRWIIRKEKLEGCGEYNNIEDRLLKEVPVQSCKEKLPSVYELIVDKEKKSVLSCGLFTAQEKVLIEKIAVSECLDKVKLTALWTGLEKKDCAYFTADSIKAADAPVSKCTNAYYLKNPFSGEYEVVEGEGLEYLSVEDIFNKNKPTPAEVYKLWFPYDKDFSMGFSLNDCRDASFGYHTVKENLKKLVDRCKPDTLYSWGPQGKLDNLKSWMGKGKWPKEYRPLFMARSPVGTFGYGAVPLRIKLRPGLNWVRTDQSHKHCDTYPTELKWNTVFYRTYEVRSNGTYLLDYTICSPGPIESWSYGHKEHYDEIVKEYYWILSPGRRAMEYELYLSGSANPLVEFRMGIDGYDFSDATLVNFMRHFQQKIQSKDGEIFWNPEVPKDQRTRRNHFSTRVPLYYNHK